MIAARVALPILASLVATACSSVPVAEQPVWPRVGSTWTMSQVATGSFGNATETIPSRALGQREWQGRRVMAVEAGGNTWYFDNERRVVAQMTGGKLTASYDPGEATLAWPLEIGKSWQTAYRYTNHASGQSVDVKFDVRVEGIETVATPAGNFEAFRISMTSPTALLSRWYSPRLGILVKDRFERTSTNRLGPGTRESILISQDIAP